MTIGLTTKRANIVTLATNLECTLSALMTFATAGQAAFTATVRLSVRTAKATGNFGKAA